MLGCHALALSSGVPDLWRTPYPTPSIASPLRCLPVLPFLRGKLHLSSQTCLGLASKTPTQRVHHQQQQPFPSLDIWDTPQGCCPFLFLWHIGMLFKKARKELRRNFRTRGTGYFRVLGQQNRFFLFGLEVCVVGEGPKLFPLILGCEGIGQLGSWRDVTAPHTCCAVLLWGGTNSSCSTSLGPSPLFSFVVPVLEGDI